MTTHQIKNNHIRTDDLAFSAYLRMKGSGRMDINSLHLLKALAAWRERTAREKNLARGFVIPDSALLQMASKKPQSVEAMIELTELHPRQLQKFQQDLLNIIGRKMDVNLPIEQEPPLNNQQRRKIEAMRQVVQHEAKLLEVDPALLASRKQLEVFLRAFESDRPVPERLKGWREAVITTKLLDLVKG